MNILPNKHFSTTSQIVCLRWILNTLDNLRMYL